MAEDFITYKKLAGNVVEKLGSVLELAQEQLDVAENDDMDNLVQFTDRRGKLINESNLITEEMSRLEPKLGAEKSFLDFKKAHIETVSELKKNIRDINNKVVDAITKNMVDCRAEIKNIAENKEALRGYGNQDYPFESAYFDTRN